jgi:hypothetical protein
MAISSHLFWSLNSYSWYPVIVIVFKLVHPLKAPGRTFIINDVGIVIVVKLVQSLKASLINVIDCLGDGLGCS